VFDAAEISFSVLVTVVVTPLEMPVESEDAAERLKPERSDRPRSSSSGRRRATRM